MRVVLHRKHLDLVNPLHIAATCYTREFVLLEKIRLGKEGTQNDS